MKDHHFNEATLALLSAVTGIREDLLRQVRIRHRRHNLLHAPWYAASKGGGGLTIGHRIHVTPTHDPATLGTDPARWLSWVLLMAHEVGHVRQAERFGFGTWGRIRFTLWAVWNYVISFLKNGTKAHGRAPFEVDADNGRTALRSLLGATGGCTAMHPVISLLMADDSKGVHHWLNTDHSAAQR